MSYFKIVSDMTCGVGNMVLTVNDDKIGASVTLDEFDGDDNQLFQWQDDDDSDKSADTGEVVKVTDDNFDEEVLGTDSMVLLSFCAPWCCHCKTLAPHLEKAAMELKGKVKIATIDCTKNFVIPKRFGIRCYPTMKVFPAGDKDGKASNFGGGRKSDSIVAWLLNQLNKNEADQCSGEVVEVTDANFDEEVLGTDLMVLLDFYAPWCGPCKRLAPEWEKAAKELNCKVKVAKVDGTKNPDLLNRFNIQAYPTINVFPVGKKDGITSEFGGGRKADTIVAWTLEQLRNNTKSNETEGKLVSKSGVALDIKHASASKGAPVVGIAFTPRDSKHQQFYLESGYIKSKLNGLVLDVKYNQCNPGQEIITWPAKSVSDVNKNQQWTLVPVMDEDNDDECSVTTFDFNQLHEEVAFCNVYTNDRHRPGKPYKVFARPGKSQVSIKFTLKEDLLDDVSITFNQNCCVSAGAGAIIKMCCNDNCMLDSDALDCTGARIGGAATFTKQTFFLNKDHLKVGENCVKITLDKSSQGVLLLSDAVLKSC